MILAICLDFDGFRLSSLYRKYGLGICTQAQELNFTLQSHGIKPLSPEPPTFLDFKLYNLNLKPKPATFLNA